MVVVEDTNGGKGNEAEEAVMRNKKHDAAPIGVVGAVVAVVVGVPVVAKGGELLVGSTL